MLGYCLFRCQLWFRKAMSLVPWRLQSSPALLGYVLILHRFTDTDPRISSLCFGLSTQVISVSTGEEHFLSWLQSEPRLLLWLSTLYRLSVSEAVQHRVRCHVCKAFPITGLRCVCVCVFIRGCGLLFFTYLFSYFNYCIVCNFWRLQMIGLYSGTLKYERLFTCT